MQLSSSTLTTPRCIFMTGGTGFLGSFLSASFLGHGDSIIFLVRPGTTLEEVRNEIEMRLQKIKGGSVAQWKQKFEVIFGDITLPHAGLSLEQRENLRSRVTDVFHAAASIRFRENPQYAWKLNVEGVRTMLEIANEWDALFHHVSTAYVAGKREGVIRENELEAGQTFNNVYEKTKYEGERLVQTFSLLPGHRAIIYRPSIVIGETEKGLTFSFNVLFYLSAKVFYNIQQWQQERRWHRLIPIRIPCHRCATINLIPVNEMVGMIDDLSRDPRSIGKTFHIVHPKATSVPVLLDSGLQILGTENVKIFFAPRFFIRILASVLTFISYAFGRKGRMLRNRILIALPYLTINKTFSTDNVREILDGKHIPRPVDTTYLEKVLRYAIEHAFKT